MTRNLIQFYARSSQNAATQARSFITAGRSPKYTSPAVSLRAALQHHHRPVHTSLARSFSIRSDNEPPKQPRRRKKRLALLLLIALPFLLSSPKQTTLNPTTFTPFTIVSREQVSPTAFILTVAPSSSPSGNAEVIRQAWYHGLWSVEIKQPQLQVSREYTPLPPLEGADDQAKGVLRFLIRRMDGGEVSGYLSRLREGDEVEIRGPRRGFDLRSRVGVQAQRNGDGDGSGEGHRGVGRKVVFLAGGTGIAPALQAARVVLGEGRPVEMEVIWANRRREDCLGCGDDTGAEKGVVVAMLEEMRVRYGGRFKYTCMVDEEWSFIDHGAIARATGVVASDGAERNWWSWSNKNDDSTIPLSRPALALNSDSCNYHSATRVMVSSDEDPPAVVDDWVCLCRDADGNRVANGKSLLIVSGPDGFVTKYAGSKLWATRKESQGEVKGIIGELWRKYPRLAEDWLVLKM
ncbi:mitochondrial peripheral inner membrane protein [Madurella fahalii]|uniref:Mitochondrial peripheral inner membrane protein n=1 Tax=Madurella fahalii TaxID=1157608 RepID=A0ABQ0GBF7_9PEZI